MGHGGHSLVLRGLYSLQLLPWMEAYPLEIVDGRDERKPRLKVLGLKEIIGSQEAVQQKVNEVYDFIGLPPHDIADVAAKNTRSYEPIKQEVRVVIWQ